MTKEQMIVAIVVAIIGVIGTSIGSVFAYLQFAVKRKDEKEEKSVQAMINDSILEARKEITAEIESAVQQGIVDCGKIGDKAIRDTQDELLQRLEDGLKQRSKEGAERFNIHAKNFEEVNQQIRKNSIQISELTEISKNVLTSMDSLNKVVRASAESQKNSNYDRILFVANKVLKNQQITITEKTNLYQLYESWVALHGVGEPLDPKIKMMYEECMKLVPIPDEQ